MESHESHQCDRREAQGLVNVVSRKRDDLGAVFWGDSCKSLQANESVGVESHRLVSLVSMDQLFRRSVNTVEWQNREL